MSTEPNIAPIAALLGEPTRAQLLKALVGGKALTPTELTHITGVTKQTISAHLARLCAAKLVTIESRGRYRYFRLAGPDVASMIENLMGLISRDVGAAIKVGPSDAALRAARVCYDHLAGETAVTVYDALEQTNSFQHSAQGMRLTEQGYRLVGELGVNVDALMSLRRPLCRTCLDWSERRYHLAGALGAALLTRFFELGWARRTRNSRAVIFSADGARRVRDWLR